MAESGPERSAPQEDADSLPLSEVAAVLLEAVRRFIQDVGELLGLEARLAGRAIAWMLGLAVLAGLLGAATWFLLLAAAYTALLDQGLTSVAALLLLAALNLAGTILCVAVTRRLSSALLFRATRRALLEETSHAQPPPRDTGT